MSILDSQMPIYARGLGGAELEYQLRDMIEFIEESATRELNMLSHSVDFQCSDYGRAVSICRAVCAALREVLSTDL